MKRVFLFLFLSLACVLGSSVYSQVSASSGVCVSGKGDFWSNWFVSAGFGGQVYFGDHNRQVSLGDRLSPSLDVSVGKWFSPAIGVRLSYSGLSARGATQNGSHGTGEVYDSSQRLEKQKFALANLHGDVLFSLSNLLCGYNPDRFYSLSPYAGLGWMVTWDGPQSREVSANVGLLNSFRLSSRLDLILDVRGSVVNDRMDGETGGRKEEGVLSATLGLSLRLGRAGWQPCRSADASAGVDLGLLRERLAALGNENDSLRRSLEAAKSVDERPLQVVEKEVVRLSPIAAPNLVTFSLGKSTLSREQRVNLGFLAAVIKESPETARYIITGYADKGTGSVGTNERLSRDRAHAVRDCLVEEYGLDPSRLEVVSSGGVDNMFYDDPRLSRAVITRVDTGKTE